MSRPAHRIEYLSNLDRVQSDFQEHIRRSIRKALHMVEVVDYCPPDELLRLDAQTYARQGPSMPHSNDLVHAVGHRAARGG